MSDFDVPAARALCDAATKLLPAALDEIERLRAALAAERKACDKYRRGHTHTNWLDDPESCFIMDNGNSKEDLRCDQCRDHDDRRAAERNKSDH